MLAVVTQKRDSSSDSAGDAQYAQKYRQLPSPRPTSMKPRPPAFIAAQAIRRLSQRQPRHPECQIRIAAGTHKGSSEHPISDMRGRREHSPDDAEP
jgi:hypothetical protein